MTTAASSLSLSLSLSLYFFRLTHTHPESWKMLKLSSSLWGFVMTEPPRRHSFVSRAIIIGTGWVQKRSFHSLWIANGVNDQMRNISKCCWKWPMSRLIHNRTFKAVQAMIDRTWLISSSWNQCAVICHYRVLVMVCVNFVIQPGLTCTLTDATSRFRWRQPFRIHRPLFIVFFFEIFFFRFPLLSFFSFLFFFLNMFFLVCCCYLFICFVGWYTMDRCISRFWRWSTLLQRKTRANSRVSSTFSSSSASADIFLVKWIPYLCFFFLSLSLSLTLSLQGSLSGSVLIIWFAC